LELIEHLFLVAFYKWDIIGCSIIYTNIYRYNGSISLRSRA